MIVTAGFSDCGGREYNEDSCLVVSHDNKLCVIVADGLGGHGGGSLASKAAVDVIRKNFEDKADKEITSEDMNRWFNDANDAVLDMQIKSCHMKTTLAVLCLEDGKKEVFASHLGDTRIYHFEDGELSYMSFDHSVSRMAVLAGEISMDEIRFHPDRNRLLKAIGAGDEVFPEIKKLTPDRNAVNAFLLCTDGFWEYVEEQYMQETLLRSATPDEWLTQMRAHIKTVVKEGNDNNSAVAVFYRM